MNIIVLAGGYSAERDVSLSSGSKIANALMKNGHKVVLLDSYKSIDLANSFEELHNKYKQEEFSYTIPQTEPDLLALKKEFGNGNALLGKNILETCQLADLVFIGLHGGIGENGKLQAVFDIFDIKYTGSPSLGSSLAMDKSVSKELMFMHEIPTAPYEIVSSISEIKMKPPYVVKPISGGSSVGVFIVRNEEEANAHILSEEHLVEKFIEGREFSVGVLDGKALPAIEIVPKSAEFFDFSSKYQGTTNEICPADIPQKIEMQLRELAVKVHNILRLECYSRSEFIVDKDENIYCLEANSLPGMTENSLLPQEARAIGIGYNELCEKIVNMAINK